ncbi:Membrane transport protein [Selenomonas ruminantium]|uniref:Membrane transport protein n=1 Tax=Selenomonas ruminantium TaxID=971 RepID=A0A1I0VN88_SELRU|nr:Membrane transport protein [Selenomonas ruminantium]
MVLQQMLIFFGLMLLGIEVKRQGLMSNENQKQLSSLVINIAYPALILSGVVGSGTRLHYAHWLLLPVICWLCWWPYITRIPSCWPQKALRLPRQQQLLLCR